MFYRTPDGMIYKKDDLVKIKTPKIKDIIFIEGYSFIKVLGFDKVNAESHIYPDTWVMNIQYVDEKGNQRLHLFRNKYVKRGTIGLHEYLVHFQCGRVKEIMSEKAKTKAN